MNTATRTRAIELQDAAAYWSNMARQSADLDMDQFERESVCANQRLAAEQYAKARAILCDGPAVSPLAVEAAKAEARAIALDMQADATSHELFMVRTEGVGFGGLYATYIDGKWFQRGAGIAEQMTERKADQVARYIRATWPDAKPFRAVDALRLEAEGMRDLAAMFRNHPNAKG